MAGQVDRQKQLAKTGSSLTFNEIVKLRAARVKEFVIQGLYKFGYRNKEDISNLPANTLVVGSQNVLTNAAEQVAIRNGYQLDGAAGNQNTYGIDSSFDFNTHSLAGTQNLRKWGTTLEVRHQNPTTNIVSWISLAYPTLPTLITTNVVNFCSYWETLGTKLVCLFVNGTQAVYRWTGAVGSFLSATSSTITLQGTTTLSGLNFDQTGILLINGNPFSYTSAGITTSTAYSQSSTAAKQTTDFGHWISQVFTTGANAVQITTVTATLNVVNTDSGHFLNGPLSIDAYIYTNNAGVPGTFLAHAVTAIPSTSVAVSGDYLLTFTFNLPVSPATSYCLVLDAEFPTAFTGVYATFSFYTGTTGATGTTTGTTSTVFAIPTNFGGVNGPLNASITENDESSTVFGGVTPDPTGFGISAGDAVIQAPSIAATTIVGSVLAEYDLIDCLSNQVYYGSLSSNTFDISKTNNYADCSASNPRLPGEGITVTIDAPPVAFKAQAQEMYISAGKGSWWRTAFTLSADLTKESLQVNPLQTATNQGAQSQGLIGKLKNSVVFVSNETIINAFGPVKNILGDPNFVNMSDPIKYDIDAYNFAGGQVYYFNYFVYVTLPAMGIERLYNVVKKYWEAPQVVPFSRHYEVNGVLYAHSGLTNESYQCYVPGLYNDNGNPINSVIAFPYVSQEGGAANQLKNFNKHYTEGYIASNTTLLLTINYDFGGYTGVYTTTITGTEANIIFNKVTDGSIGQNTLGSEPIGSILNLPNQPAIPKFRIINTFPRLDCFEYQIVLSSDDVDQNYAILRSGPAVSASDNLPVQITV